MNYPAGVLLRPQKIDIFSKKKSAPIRMRWPLLAVLIFCVFVGLFAVWQRVQYVRIGYDIQVLKQEHDKLVQEKRKLLLEYNTSVSLDKVEATARKRLKMDLPEEGQIIYVR
jgi:cell division protein FtsL